ncbi:hypothetical protein [Streptomyces indicus]|uniref:DUF3558 domain-containing protein n=1 Tax=Streptomyces indicus TaxID=417292 RepID=A0A1G9JBI7_9ACTN|nr:hypothetical protein [Streptomyces indicus]SDL34900.1 hypothetical protein SAMN05421806_12928 [Streptomyces indicus]
MRHKGYLAGAATLAALLLTGCTSDAGGGSAGDDGKPGGFAPSPTKAAEPGRYRSLPEPCDAVGRDSLDSMLPGIAELSGEQREKAYAGTAAVTFDTDRRSGCRWSVESPDATHRLHVDFERVVSYDDAVSDDELAADLFLDLKIAADLPEPATDEETDEETGEETGEGTGGATDEGAGTDKESGKPSGDPTATAGGGDGKGGEPGTGEPSGSTSASPPEGLEPRALDDLADEAYLDDELGAADSAARKRLVTVVFRTSNVLVTVAYEAQSASVQETPDSKELQDRARVLAGKLAEQFTE